MISLMSRRRSGSSPERTDHAILSQALEVPGTDGLAVRSAPPPRNVGLLGAITAPNLLHGGAPVVVLLLFSDDLPHEEAKERDVVG